MALLTEAEFHYWVDVYDKYAKVTAQPLPPEKKPPPGLYYMRLLAATNPNVIRLVRKAA